MPSHFSTIGIPGVADEDFTASIERAIDEAVSIDVDRGTYLLWTSESGAQLWMQLDPGDELIGANPHFDGASKVEVGLVEVVQRPQDTILDGAYSAWADPPADDLETGAYPFLFALPGFYASPVSVPSRTTAQIAAFAHEIEVHESPEQFLASQEEDAKFASQSFIPGSMFDLMDDEESPPQAQAMMTGHIRQCEKRRNELADRPFWWLLVDSLGGTFDVVVDPVLMSGVPQVGGVASGSFWLSGRLVTRDGT